MTTTRIIAKCTKPFRMCLWVLPFVVVWALSMPVFADAAQNTLVLSMSSASTYSTLTDPVFENQPIIRVDLKTKTLAGLEYWRSLVDLELGQPLSFSALRANIKRLYSVGGLSDVRVYLSKENAGVVVTLELVQEIRYNKIVFLGDKHKEVEKSLREFFLSLDHDNLQLLSDLELRCQNEWQKVGYFNSRCHAQIDTDSSEHTISLQMFRGVLVRVRQVDFRGHVQLKPIYLNAGLKLKPGAAFVQADFKEDEKQLKHTYFSQGFLFAQIKSHFTVDERQGTADLVFDIDASSRTQFELLGVTKFSHDKLLELLWTEGESTLLEWSFLDTWKTKVVSLYQRFGYYLATASLQFKPAQSSRPALVQLRVQEGFYFELARVEFVGAKQIKAARLKEELDAEITKNQELSAITPSPNRALIQQLMAGPSVLEDNAPKRSSSVIQNHALFLFDATKVYDAPVFLLGLEHLKNYYRAQGFLSASVDLESVVQDDIKHQITVYVRVNEGVQTRVQSVLIKAHSATLPVEAQMSLLPVKVQAPLQIAQVESAQSLLVDTLVQQGYLYAQVEPQLVFSKDQSQVDIQLIVDAGPQVKIRQVFVWGAEQVLESVIIQRVKQLRGRIYRPQEVLQLQDELRQIDKLESVNIALLDPDVRAWNKDLIVRVSERKNYLIEARLGISTAQGVLVGVDFTHRNVAHQAVVFNFHGQLNAQMFAFSQNSSRFIYGPAGDRMYERYKTYQKSVRGVLLDMIDKDIRFGFHLPRYTYLKGQPALNFELAYERRNNVNFRLHALNLLGGLNVVLAKSLMSLLEMSFAYHNVICDQTNADSESTQIRCSDLTLPGAQMKVEHFFIFKFSPTLVFDKRQDKLNPRQGLFASLKTDFAFGSPILTNNQAPTLSKTLFSYIKLEAQLSGYIPVLQKSSIALSVRAGNIFSLYDPSYVIDSLPQERFFLGGQDTLRGISPMALVPRDDDLYRQKNGLPAVSSEVYRTGLASGIENKGYVNRGGAFYFLTKGEFRFNVRDPLLGAVFVDVGTLYQDPLLMNQRFSLAVNVGLGIRLKTPVGSLALDWGLHVTPMPRFGEAASVFSTTNLIAPIFYFGIF